MNFALVEDTPIGIPRANNAFEVLKERGMKLEENFSALVNDWATLRSYIKQIRSMKGPLILCIDRHLSFDVDRTLAKEYDFDEMTRLSGVAEEGLAIAIEAIRNHQIQPLLIVTTSAMGVSDEIQGLLETLIQKEQRTETAATITSIRSRRFTQGTDYSIEIIENAIEQFQHLFSRVSHFSKVMDEIKRENPLGAGTAKDGDGHDYADANWCSLTGKLLDLPAADIKLDFPSGQQFIGEAYKEFGLCPRYCLSLGSVWLIALSAFRYRHPLAAWKETFNPTELTSACFKAYSCIPAQQRETFQASIEALHTMFQLLFQKDEKHAASATDGHPHGPLKKVTLKPGSLTFEFGFPLKVAGRDDTMADYLCQRIGGEIGRHPALHGTTSAIWNFYLHSLLDDHTSPENYQFPSRCSRISLRATDSGKSTLLTFQGVD